MENSKACPLMAIYATCHVVCSPFDGHAPVPHTMLIVHLGPPFYRATIFVGCSPWFVSFFVVGCLNNLSRGYVRSHATTLKTFFRRSYLKLIVGSTLSLTHAITYIKSTN